VLKHIEQRLGPLDTRPTYNYLSICLHFLLLENCVISFMVTMFLYTPPHNCTWLVITCVIFMQLIIHINYILADNIYMDFICLLQYIERQIYLDQWIGIQSEKK